MITQTTPLQIHRERKRMPVASMLDPTILVPAVPQAFRKLDPRLMVKNPVMFVVEVVTVLTTVLLVRDLLAGNAGTGFSFQIVLWLWFTLLFASFAEAVAEGRGKAQAASLRRTRTEAKAKLVASAGSRDWREVSALALKPGDLVLVEAGDLIPSDGEIMEGVASVDESAITGESAPVIRESGGDRSAVTGGTRVLSDQILVRIIAAQGCDSLEMIRERRLFDFPFVTHTKRRSIKTFTAPCDAMAQNTSGRSQFSWEPDFFMFIHMINS